MPAKRAKICEHPMAKAPLARAVERLEPDVTAAVAPQAFADQQDDAVDGEEDRRGERLGEEDAQLVLEQQPAIPTGTVATASTNSSR